MDLSLMIESLPRLLEGAVLTLKLLLLTEIIGFICALPLGILYANGSRAARTPIYAFVYFFRGTPLLVQIFIVYYGLAQFDFVRQSVLWPWLRQPFVCALLACALHSTAYTTNILRGAIQAVPAGEVEAARACGMSAFQVQRFIVLPIAFRLMLPAYSNQAIGMLKGTSLASTITLMELTGVANTIVASTFQPYEVFIMAALIYLTITLVITRCFKYLEYALSKHQRPLKSSAAIPGQVRHAD
ncbi:amino acid ABC transporter membrane protein 2 (PAAT family) [Bosea sp. AK1]|uniref:ABC transporter permease n=1 Tax=Bosea sp. AK1 TaxID=2587160 RepID=UPI00114EED66|nr:ABC transporter permease [Bosea sp. AK1]TQI74766.1 amino acid ABC transporter membrane protein 2 (PAAT family) [Bosea sp. AK1]